MALNGCGQFCKWMIILFNILFILVGLCLIIGSLYLYITAADLKTKHFIFMVGLCISIGVVIVITAVIGDCGSWGETKAALSVYVALLIVLGAVAAIGGGVAYVNNKSFSNHVAEFYTTIYAQYMLKGDMIRAFLLKLFHDKFECCGMGGLVQTFTGTTSICPEETNILGISVSTSSNCFSVITTQMEASSVLIFFIVIAGILFMAMGCSVVLYYNIKNSASYSAPLFY